MHSSFTVSTEITAPPETVFAYIADLTKHGEWSANELRIEPVDNAPLGVGKKYRSHAAVRGQSFDASLQIAAYNPPATFAFTGQDSTGKFTHHFTIEPIENRTRLTRRVTFELSLPQYLFYLIALNSVRLPAARAALQALKKDLENQTSRTQTNS